MGQQTIQRNTKRLKAHSIRRLITLAKRVARFKEEGEYSGVDPDDMAYEMSDIILTQSNWIVKEVRTDGPTSKLGRAAAAVPRNPQL